jgi:AraC-like DNA-binding protein
MKHLELLPCPSLRPYVQLIWCFELDGTESFGPAERIAPDGIVEMVFHYRDPMAIRFGGERFVVQPRSSIVSQTRRYVEIRPAGPAGFVSVRLRPWGAHHFLAPPVSQIADRQVAAEELWGGEAWELEERLAESADTRTRVSLVEGFLLRQLRRHQKTDVEPLVRAVWARRGQVRVKQLGDELGLTERSLQRLFASALGIPPKGFARLVRFQNACSTLRRGRWTSLTQVSHDCGYYDQAHFISDFKSFSGMTPGAFVKGARLSYLEPA